MHKSITLALTFLITLIIFISCDEDTLTGPENGSNILIINHNGVDWSEGIVGSETEYPEQSDGETIAWCPNGGGGGWYSGIWYRSAKGHIYSVGTGNLSDIINVDTTKWSNDICDTPLINGELWVTEALDGYVAFKVIDAPTDSSTIANSLNWGVEVEYKFSTTLGF